MTEHELTEEKIGELFDEIHQPPPYSNWDCLGSDEVSREVAFARAAYDLGKQASATVSGSGWADDELRAAVHEAAENARGRVLSINQDADYPLNVHSDMVADLRHLLTALGIDHQPKPELPTEVGSMIYDAVDTWGNSYSVLTLDDFMDWCGVDQNGSGADLAAHEVASFGGVLDLNKVRSIWDA